MNCGKIELQWDYSTDSPGAFIVSHSRKFFYVPLIFLKAKYHCSENGYSHYSRTSFLGAGAPVEFVGAGHARDVI